MASKPATSLSLQQTLYLLITPDIVMMMGEMGTVTITITGTVTVMGNYQTGVSLTHVKTEIQSRLR
jgi:hypothetical protein